MANTVTEVSTISSPLMNSHGKATFFKYGRVKMDTGAGSEAVTVDGAAVGDMVLISVEQNDSGTPSTVPFTAMISATNTLTITRGQDDSSSADDASVTWLVLRP